MDSRGSLIARTWQHLPSLAGSRSAEHKCFVASRLSDPRVLLTYEPSFARGISRSLRLGSQDHSTIPKHHSSSQQGTVYANHAVGAVGIGAAIRGELILIRNSWGASWGDQGHAWLDDAFLVEHLIGMLLLTVEVV